MTAYEKELMNGVTDKTFEPLTAMNRAMLVTMLYRLEGSPAVEGKRLRGLCRLQGRQPTTPTPCSGPPRTR